jgi:hypothetical protein
VALDTYTNLRAEIADFVNRDDLSSVIPTFILLTEVELNRRLRDRRMLRRAIATLSLQYLRLPSGLVSLRDIQLNSDPPVPLAGSTPQALNDLRAGSNQSGKPRHYAHLGEQIEVYPTPDAAYEIEIAYYGTIPALSDSTATNWVLDYYPDLYLWGALKQAAKYLGDQQLNQNATSAFDAAIVQAVVTNESATISGVTAQVKINPIG